MARAKKSTARKTAPKTARKTARKPAKKTASKSTRSKKAAAPAEPLLVGSKVRNAIKDSGMNTGGDAIDGLNQWVHWLIQQATHRAEANGRKTVRAHDFMAP